MQAAEETIDGRKIPKRIAVPIVDRFLDYVSSVRFGIILLILLVILSMIGMLIIQQNVQGFDVYYASLTRSERLVFGALGFFDIYYSWYFKLLLLVLSVNIILASIDRFPSAWSYIRRPKRDGTKEWILARKQNATLHVFSETHETAAEKIRGAMEAGGLKAVVTERNGSLYVFGERGKYNRLGAYVVHVALLLLFIGHFVALQTGFDADVRMIPGDTTSEIQMLQFDLDKKERFNVQIPFTITCTDIQQELIDPRGSINITNTLDWRTQIKIDDPEYGQTVADVSMNRPFSYRGYRFFQAQTIPVGNARKITIAAAPQSGGEPIRLEIQRAGSATMPDGTLVEYEDFQPDFTFNQAGSPDTRSGDYNNPVAVLGVTPKGGDRTRVFAFAANVADNIPVGAPKAGYKWRLADFEKSPFAHVLSIKYDPYEGAFIAWYIGGFGLIGALCFVFFFSHKRIWALIENRGNGMLEISLGGEANRNHSGFEEKFLRVIAGIRRKLGVDVDAN